MFSFTRSLNERVSHAGKVTPASNFTECEEGSRLKVARRGQFCHSKLIMRGQIDSVKLYHINNILIRHL